MATNVIESDVYTTTIKVPDDVTDDADQASLLDNFVQGLANRTNFLQRRIPAVASPTGVWLHVPLTPLACSSSAAPTTAGSQFYISQTDITGPALGTVKWSIQEFYGAKIIACRLRLKGAAGHAALPDFTMPLFGIYSVTTGNTVPAVTAEATAFDTSANVAAYELAHYITLTGLNLPYDPEKLYYLQAQGEDGTGSNEVVGLRFYAAQIMIAPV